MATTERTKLEQEILDMTKQKPQREGEKRSAYLMRLIESANSELTDRDWKKLSRPLQQWVNDGIDALGEKPPKKVAEFPADEEEDDSTDDEAETTEDEDIDEPDDEEAEETEDEDKEEDADEEEKDDSDDDEDTEETEDDDKDETDDEETEEEADDDDEEPAAPERKKLATASAPAKKATEGEAKQGATAYMRALICKNPTADKKALAKALKDKKYEIGEQTFNLIYYTTTATIKELTRIGKLKA